MELYGERLREFGKRKADVKFIVDVLMLFRPGITRRVRTSYFLNNYTMFGNYFKVGIRNILKYKAFSFINVFGLSIGMAVCLLVILMLADQLAYDQFHPDKDRVYRILSERPYGSMPFASTPSELAATLRDEYTVVENAMNLITGVGGEAIYHQQVSEMRGFFADENFFRVFGYELENGNRERALNSPNTIVITSETARRLFGDENPLGKSVEFIDRGLHYLKTGKDSSPVSWGSFTITGVIADKNYKSHLKFDVLMSASSRKVLSAENKLHGGDSWDRAYTYVLLDEGKTALDLDASLNELFRRKYSQEEPFKGYSLKAQPLTAITPGIIVNQPPSFQLPVESYYFLGFVALAIMLSACLNYTNLSTARALTRLKEIGIRKVTGAYRKDLVFQFLSESVITAFFALVLAVVLLIFLKPAFVGLWLNRYLDFDLQAGPAIYIIFAGFALVMGIVAGLFPALHLSTFRPVSAIKNSVLTPGGRMGIRKVLSVSQFVISLFFVVTSILVYTQFRYFMRFDYGFDAQNVVNVSLQGNDFQKIANAFSAVAGIADISASEYVPATGRSSGMQLNHPESHDPIQFRILSASENFLDNLGINLIAGRGLTLTTDTASRFIVINEAAVKALGFKQPGEIVGTTLISSWNKEALEVVGVVEDFWVKLPIGGDGMEPVFLRNLPSNFSYANIRVTSGNENRVIAQLEQAWKKVDPAHPFKYEFYEDELDSTHAGIFDVVSIVGFLAFVAVTIACLGMLGMATYTAERKRKEVGIRKVLGADDSEIAYMLSRDFLRVLLIAAGIGGPLSYIVNNLWLEVFPTRAEFGIGIVIQGTLILLVLGLLTIGSQTIRASRRNPVDSLKAE